MNVAGKPDFAFGEKLDAVIALVESGQSLSRAMRAIGYSPSVAYHWAEKDEGFRRRLEVARSRLSPLKRHDLSSNRRWDELMTADAVRMVVERIRAGERQAHAVKAVIGMTGSGPSYYRWKGQRPEIASQIDAAVDARDSGGFPAEVRDGYIRALREGWGKRKAANAVGVSVTVVNRWLWAPYRSPEQEAFAHAAAEAWEVGRGKREAPDAKRRRRYDSTMRSLHGVSADDVEAMLARQGGKCPGCEMEIRLYAGTGAETGAALDHCHVTGRVRGLLCPGCNTALGAVKDDPQRLARLQRYIEAPPSLQ